MPVGLINKVAELSAQRAVEIIDYIRFALKSDLYQEHHHTCFGLLEPEVAHQFSTI